MNTTLRAISLKNFKSHRDTTVVLKPLTVLAGRNSSGKSSLMQPLLLFKQTLEAPYVPEALVLSGPLLQYDWAAVLPWRPGREQSWSVTLELASSGGGALHVGGVYRSEGNTLVRERAGTYAFFDEPAEARKIFSDLIYIPGLRAMPRAYPAAAVGEVFSGLFHMYVASILDLWMQNKPDRLVGVALDLRALHLTSTLRTQRLNSVQIAVYVGRRPGGALDTDDLVNLADVGVGVSQALPIVVALRAARPGQLVHIEQPELHLHPDAQVAMAGLLIAAMRRGVQVIVETHSSVLLRALQVAVAEDPGALHELIALHWFDRDAEGATVVTTADLHPDGSAGDWPVDFADVEMAIDLKFIQANAKKHRKPA